MLGKRKYTGGGRGIGKRRATGPRSSVGVSGAGVGSVRYAGRDWYGTVDSPTADAAGALGTYAGLNPLKNVAIFERLKDVVKGFSQYRFRKLNFIVKGQGGPHKGQFCLCYFHNDGKGGSITITNEAAVKATGNCLSVRGDSSGIFRCKQDLEWLATDTNVLANSVLTSPGVVYYFINATTGLADCTWDIWVDYVIEMKDPVRIGTLD